MDVLPPATGFMGKLPPQNLDAEMGVLGSILLMHEAIDEVGDVLKADHFYAHRHQTIFAAVMGLYENGVRGIDAVTLAEELDRRKQLDEIGGVEYLAKILGVVPNAAHAKYYAKIVRDRWIQRSLVYSCTEILEDCYGGSNDTDDILTSAERKVFNILEQRESTQSTDIGEILTAACARIEDRRQLGGRISGLSSGFIDLDQQLNGFQNSELIILAARPSMGKAQPVDAMVLTPRGFVPLGVLRVSDEVIGADGNPTTITGIYPQGELAVYRVAMSDGGSTECCGEHLWWTQTRNERRRGSEGSVKTTSEIAATIHRPDGGLRNHAIPTVPSVRFDAPYEDLPLDSYALGLLLGDGCFRGQSVRFSNPECDIIEQLNLMIPVEDRVHCGPDGVNHIIIRRHFNGRPSKTKQAIKQLGLLGLRSEKKFIPKCYLFADEVTRLNLLRGLFDSDGYVTDSGCSVEYTTSSPQLSEDVRFLVRSLGGIISCRSRIPVFSHVSEKRHGLESFRMVACFPNGMIPVSSQKHLLKWTGKPSRQHRSITSIELVGYKECQCIKVSAANQLYVTDDFIVTHNTALVCNIAEAVVSQAMRGCLIFSLEMSELELAERLLCLKAKVNGHRLRSGMIDDMEHEALMQAAAALSKLPLYIDDRPGRSMAQISAVARRLKRRHGLGLIIIDYVQLIEPEDSRSPREQQVAQITRRLKHLAKELDVPVIALAQLNRGVENREDKRPRLADLRESGSLEQDADVVLFIHKPSAYDPEDRPGEVDLLVAKNRNGPIGNVTLTWLSDNMRFGNMAERRHCQYEAAAKAFPAERRLPKEHDQHPEWRDPNNRFSGNRDR